MPDIVLNAAKREFAGKKYAKQLRREEKVPGIFYAHKEESIPLIFDIKEIQKLVGTEISLFDLKIDKKKAKKCIIKEVQFDPVSHQPLHLDIMGVKLKEKITVSIPIHIVGEALGVKEEGGILNQTLYELDVSCLPLDIPEYVDVDVTDLKVGNTIHVSDIKLDIDILNEPEVVVVGIAIPRAAKEFEEVEAEPTELEESETEEDKQEADKES